VVKTSPDTYMADCDRAMKLAGYRKHLRGEIILKLNLSWSLFYPACSSSPWQLEAVLETLKGKTILPVENQTVVTDPWKGAWLNKWLPILEKYGLEFIPLTDAKWVEYEPKTEMLAMNDLFKDQILVPEMFFDKSVLHLPTMKTHGHTTTTGSIKNAFGGLIPKYRHHSHKYIHEIITDLLVIQQDIHKGIFSVIDGAVAGDGAGPRTMEPRIENLIIAGADQVAVDSTMSAIMGFEPLNIGYIRLSHELGLGVGDTDKIKLVGDFKQLPKKDYRVNKSPVIFFDQFFRKKLGSSFPWLERMLFHTKLFHLPIMASSVYHDKFWYPLIGKKKIAQFEKTSWGKKWLSYEKGPRPQKTVKGWDPY
ncbi:MAG: DUF362 domain-containing protein, partial [Candidatus Altiarchaeota archaeon]|nr:DUF362 domain-containing protein [Candidatus Altiarchaeota archaeon]